MARVHKEIGSKDRLYEMFKNVNKVMLNESFDSPAEKDERYLNKGGDDKAFDQQPNKYDDGIRYPVEEPLKVDDESLESLKGDDAPLTEEELDEISWSGIKQAGKFVGKSIGDAVKGVTTAISDKVSQVANDIAQQYHRGARNKVIGELEQMASQFGEDFGQLLTKINDRAEKAGDEPIPVQSIVQTISNSIVRNVRSGGSGVSLKGYRKEGVAEAEELEGGLADGQDPQNFDPEQVSKGIKIEMEHTSDPKEALEIAMDHLMEIPDYYDHLEDMEAEAEESREEDTLLDPSTHWVDHYTPKGLGEAMGLDPEAGEQAWEEEREVKQYSDLESIGMEMARLRDAGDKQALMNFIQGLKVIPKVNQSRGREHGLGHRELEELGLVRVGLEYFGDEEGELYIENTSDKDIVTFDPRSQRVFPSVLRPGEDTK